MSCYRSIKTPDEPLYREILAEFWGTILLIAIINFFAINSV